MVLVMAGRVHKYCINVKILQKEANLEQLIVGAHRKAQARCKDKSQKGCVMDNPGQN